MTLTLEKWYVPVYIMSVIFAFINFSEKYKRVYQINQSNSSNLFFIEFMDCNITCNIGTLPSAYHSKPSHHMYIIYKKKQNTIYKLMKMIYFFVNKWGLFFDNWARFCSSKTQLYSYQSSFYWKSLWSFVRAYVKCKIN